MGICVSILFKYIQRRGETVGGSIVKKEQKKTWLYTGLRPQKVM